MCFQNCCSKTVGKNHRKKLALDLILKEAVQAATFQKKAFTEGVFQKFSKLSRQAFSGNTSENLQLSRGNSNIH